MWIVILFASAYLLPALGGFRVLTQHEVFAAEPAREMISGGNWIIPQFVGKPRKVKPPGMGWLIATSMSVFQSRSEWVVRLPSAIAAIVTAASVAWLAGRWLGDLTGLIAGLMQASFAYVLMQAKLAEADMPLCAAVTVAMVAFAVCAVEEQGGTTPRRYLGWPLAFALGTSAAFMLKGVPLLFILAGCLWYVLVLMLSRWIPQLRFCRKDDADFLTPLRFLFHPVSFAVMLVLVAAWPLAAWRASPDIVEVWRRETYGRATGEMGDPDPWFVYLWAVPFLLLPWLPFAIRGFFVFRSRPNRLDRPFLFLWCWFIGGMVLLQFSQWKHKHYCIPMLPPLTLLAACGFVDWLAAARAKAPIALDSFTPAPDSEPAKRAWLWPIAISLVAGLIAMVCLLKFGKQGKVEMAVTANLIAVGVAATLGLYANRRTVGVIVACFGTALVGGLAFQFLIIPAFDDYRASANLGRRASKVVPAGKVVNLALLGEVQTAFYIDRPMVRYDRSEELEAFIRSSHEVDQFVLCPESAKPALSGYADVVELDRVSQSLRKEKDPTVLLRVKAKEGLKP